MDNHRAFLLAFLLVNDKGLRRLQEQRRVVAVKAVARLSLCRTRGAKGNTRLWVGGCVRATGSTPPPVTTRRLATLQRSTAKCALAAPQSQIAQKRHQIHSRLCPILSQLVACIGRLNILFHISHVAVWIDPHLSRRPRDNRRRRLVAKDRAKVIGVCWRSALCSRWGQMGSNGVNARKMGCTQRGCSPLEFIVLGKGGTGIESAPCGCGFALPRSLLFSPDGT